jgi:hypothetical protein
MIHDGKEHDQNQVCRIEERVASVIEFQESLEVIDKLLQVGPYVSLTYLEAVQQIDLLYVINNVTEEGNECEDERPTQGGFGDGKSIIKDQPTANKGKDQFKPNISFQFGYY